MKLHTMKGTVRLLVFSTALMVLSCKGKQDNKEVDTTTNADTVSTYDTSNAVTTAPDPVSEAQLRDAIKDFPGVTATVNNGEVTLTGTIERDNLSRLMQSVQALNPKKVNNNLTIK
jgi:osmotically-inducible protein OsmY